MASASREKQGLGHPGRQSRIRRTGRQRLGFLEPCEYTPGRSTPGKPGYQQGAEEGPQRELRGANGSSAPLDGVTSKRNEKNDSAPVDDIRGSSLARKRVKSQDPGSSGPGRMCASSGANAEKRLGAKRQKEAYPACVIMSRPES